ncbi:MAG: hypothetical protein FWE95_02220 [Planctomycetaceae bacterium]|nr:hypothetical protein [Planctomycetaceae bacterium]
MIRTSLVALLSLCLAAALVAKEPDSQPQSELEAIAVNVMTKAFQVADYDTVEALFDKLSPENKIKFLQEANAMTRTCYVELAKAVGEMSTPIMFADISFHSRMAGIGMGITSADIVEALSETLELYTKEKADQTQLLGRLTLSLFEPAVVATLQVAEIRQTPLVVHELDYHVPRELVVYPLKNTQAVEVASILNDYIRNRLQVLKNLPDAPLAYHGQSDAIVVPDEKSNSLIIEATPQYFDDIMAVIEEIDRSPHEPPPVPPVAVAPPGMAPFVLPGHDDGYITLNSYGRVYIKGLDASEIIDAITFHLSRYIEHERVAANQSAWSTEMRSMVALDEPMNDEAKLIIDKWDWNQFWSVPHHGVRMHYPNAGRW